jgi:hypothetical protein
MPVVPFAEFRPDVSDYEGAGQHTKNVLNVVPRGDGYGPFRELSAYTATLGSACRGFFHAKKADGTVSVFAGTSTKLYQLLSTDLSFSDVSQGSSAYAALGSGAQWQFAQFNKYVVATQQNAPPQFFSLTSSTDFQDITGSPPQAAHVAIVNRFLVLSGIISPNVYRVHWSDLNDIFTWSSGSADSQDFADGGIVRGIAGGEFGVIFQDTSIRRMVFAPGSPYVFGIERIAQDDGIYAPYSMVGSGDRVFYISNDGFKMIQPGGLPEDIGKERVDRYFFDDVDTGNLQLVIGVHDSTKTRVYWAYKSNNGATGQFDKVLCFDWALKKWSLIQTSGEYMAAAARPGVTLEGVDTAYGSNIDTLTLTSLDDITTASLSELSAFDANHKLGFYDGLNLAATLETGEQGGDGQLIHIKGARVVTDSPDVTCAISRRMTPQSTTAYSTATAINTETGVCPAHVTTRYARAKVSITAGSTWTFAAGVEPDFALLGRR